MPYHCSKPLSRLQCIRSSRRQKMLLGVSTLHGQPPPRNQSSLVQSCLVSQSNSSLGREESVMGAHLESVFIQCLHTEGTEHWVICHSWANWISFILFEGRWSEIWIWLISPHFCNSEANDPDAVSSIRWLITHLNAVLRTDVYKSYSLNMLSHPSMHLFFMFIHINLH